MALTLKKTSNFAGMYGSPADDTAWEECSWNFSAQHVVVIVEQGSTDSLEISMNGVDKHLALPIPEVGMNPMKYSFPNCNLSRMWFRKTGTSIQVCAFGVK